MICATKHFKNFELGENSHYSFKILLQILPWNILTIIAEQHYLEHLLAYSLRGPSLFSTFEMIYSILEFFLKPTKITVEIIFGLPFYYKTSWSLRWKPSKNKLRMICGLSLLFRNLLEFMLKTQLNYNGNPA